MISSIKFGRPDVTGGPNEYPTISVRLKPYMLKYLNERSKDMQVSLASIVRIIIQDKITEDNKFKGNFYESR